MGTIFIPTTTTPVDTGASMQATDNVGDIVRISGPPVGSLYQVERVDPLADTTMPGVAMVMAKTTATEGSIRFLGEIQGLYVGLTPGATLYVGFDGRISETEPLSPRIIQKVGVAMSADTIYFNPDLTYEEPTPADILLDGTTLEIVVDGVLFEVVTT